MNHQDNIGGSGQYELIKRRRSEIPDPERVLTLQGKLYQKAKLESGYRFYVLYDKMFIPYILREAWKQVKKNAGSPGVDGVTIADVENYGVDSYLEELAEELRKRTYRPKAVKRVMILKANGGERPLGIPTVRDRIAQTACKMILEPIFEADFKDCSHGFRPNRSAKGAMQMIKGNLVKGKTQILDADLSKYFDTIPHDKLITAVKLRISDPRMLQLIEMWLKCPVYEDGQFKGGKKQKMGTPQGGVISPLLANLYMHLLDRIVSSTKSLFHQYGVSIVRYADDFVLMGKSIPLSVLSKLKELLDRMGLTLNGNKTRLIEARNQTFDFLGFTVRYSEDLFVKGRRYWEIFSSRKSEAKIRERIKGYLKTGGHYAPQKVSEGLNSIIRGWLNYFDAGGISYMKMPRRRLRKYLLDTVSRYYNRKSQRKSRLYRQKAFEVLKVRYGLIDPTKYSLSLNRQ
jgi:RNA-directed DNA polymerase